MPTYPTSNDSLSLLRRKFDTLFVATTKAKEAIASKINATDLFALQNNTSSIRELLENERIKPLLALLAQEIETLSKSLSINTDLEEKNKKLKLIGQSLDVLKTEMRKNLHTLYGISLEGVEQINKIHKEQTAPERLDVAMFVNADMGHYPVVSSEQLARKTNNIIKLQGLRSLYLRNLLSWLKHNDQAEALRKMASIMTDLRWESTEVTTNRLWWVAEGYVDFIQNTTTTFIEEPAYIFRRLDDCLRKTSLSKDIVALENEGEEKLIKKMLFYISLGNYKTMIKSRILKGFSIVVEEDKPGGEEEIDKKKAYFGEKLSEIELKLNQLTNLVDTKDATKDKTITDSRSTPTQAVEATLKEETLKEATPEENTPKEAERQQPSTDTNTRQDKKEVDPVQVETKRKVGKKKNKKISRKKQTGESVGDLPKNLVQQDLLSPKIISNSKGITKKHSKKTTKKEE